ncbi:hypothetical protein OCC_14050 [Thermococcus litoralis DSM 5473]|uniref:Uncharacterized protein n=1 Tax=Thermococcus litoralis (strain ATCC 51850 / DSM 5473 / JCM 8560 / NS-C) TaxID=523849 RepID=S6A4K4_THELN|nr:hypothetical protein OCC_14050 [Thermococcus litoralis DSM 5473]
MRRHCQWKQRIVLVKYSPKLGKKVVVVIEMGDVPDSYFVSSTEILRVVE